MKEIELGEVQMRFADIIWEHEPVSSGDLVKICSDKLNWKKSTTYTVLRKLCEKGLFKNDNGIVSSEMSKEDFFYKRGESVLEASYGNSLPAFIAAFISRGNLTKAEADEIKKMIDEFEKE